MLNEEKLKSNFFSELTNLGLLMEEVGEVARLMTRIWGPEFQTEGG